jgi:hypothetical protein
LGDAYAEAVLAADAVVESVGGSERVVPLTRSRNAVFGDIPGTLVAGPVLTYYLRVTLTDGSVVTFPSGAPESTFIVRVIGLDDREAREGPDVPTASAGSEAEQFRVTPSVDILSPLPGEVAETETPHIAALFDPAMKQPWEAVVLLDGEDLTDVSTITSELLVLAPTEPLSRGMHRMTFSAVTPLGAVEASWVFFVLEKTEVEEATWPADGAGLRYSAPVLPAGEDTGGWRGALEDDWFVSGRLEAGWAAVAAETTDVDTTDVFLPYQEVSGSLIDVHVSAARGDVVFLLTARRDPVYSRSLEWFASANNERLELEVGQLFPSLSQYTLDWAVGHGARASARLGRSTTEILGMRTSEVDTVEGFGFYSRFAAGGRQTFDWTKSLSTSLIYLSIFDREESLSEEQRLTDPLSNEMVAGQIHAVRGPLTWEAEFAGSRARGETEGRGTAFRAMARFERDWRNWVSLEYAASEPGFYSAGSYLREPGEHVVQIDYAYSPTDRLSSSGWMSLGRSLDSDSALAEDALELKIYARVQTTWSSLNGDAETYAIVRYDHAPYESYDYSYTYAVTGGAWRRRGTQLAASVSWSRASSPSETDTWSASGTLRRDLIEDRWSARAGATWTTASGDGAAVDYSRLRLSVDTNVRVGSMDTTAEYWMIERDDRADPVQSYTEHVFRISLGRDL